jgi:hypothetical protein
MFNHFYIWQYTILIINIFSYILLKIIKIVYFINIHKKKKKQYLIYRVNCMNSILN